MAGYGDEIGSLAVLAGAGAILWILFTGSNSGGGGGSSSGSGMFSGGSIDVALPGDFSESFNDMVGRLEGGVEADPRRANQAESNPPGEGGSTVSVNTASGPQEITTEEKKIFSGSGGSSVSTLDGVSLGSALPWKRTQEQARAGEGVNLQGARNATPGDFV